MEASDVFAPSRFCLLLHSHERLEVIEGAQSAEGPSTRQHNRDEREACRFLCAG